MCGDLLLQPELGLNFCQIMKNIFFISSDTLVLM